MSTCLAFSGQTCHTSLCTTAASLCTAAVRPRDCTVSCLDLKPPGRVIIPYHMHRCLFRGSPSLSSPNASSLHLTEYMTRLRPRSCSIISSCLTVWVDPQVSCSTFKYASGSGLPQDRAKVCLYCNILCFYNCVSLCLICWYIYIKC